mgnify:CR=1 FL=1
MVLSSCIQITQVFALRKSLGNATEATIIMGIGAVKYLMIAGIYWIAFTYIGSTVIAHYKSYYEVTAELMRIILGLVDPDIIDPYWDQNPGVG